MTNEAEGTNRPEPFRMGGMLNYLRWFPAEDMYIEFNAETSLQWFCKTLPYPHLLEVLKSRYKKLEGADNNLFFFPTDHRALVEKLLIPLDQAKIAFILGHELGCIALCGMVGEMLTILRFQMSDKAFDEKKQNRLFGKKFEALEQAVRVGMLELMGLIDEPTANLFRDLRKTRNRYLHNLSESHDALANDANRAYRTVAKLVTHICGFDVGEKHVKMNPELLRFIQMGGLGVDQSDPDDS